MDARCTKAVWLFAPPLRRSVSGGGSLGRFFFFLSLLANRRCQQMLMGKKCKNKMRNTFQVFAWVIRLFVHDDWSKRENFLLQFFFCAFAILCQQKGCTCFFLSKKKQNCCLRELSCIQSNSLCHSIKELIDNDPVVRALILGWQLTTESLKPFKLSQ